MRYLARMSYDGTNYHGYQIQPDQRTIQQEVETVLKRMHKGRTVKIVASGRTDAGVHAIGQAFHFDSDLDIPVIRWVRALNAQLPEDIVVLNVVGVPSDFHARFDVVEKWYDYHIHNSSIADPFKRHYSDHVSHPLNVGAMQQACEHLLGTHDFTAFCATNSNVTDSKVRTIYQATCKKTADNMIIFSVSGNGFLYNMVRIIVGTLIDVGYGRKSPTVIKEALVTLDRNTLGKTAPAKGLYLKKVVYDKN